MIKFRYVIFLFLLSAFVAGLFQIKFKVQVLHRELAELKQQLEQEKNSIHVLKAEWAYLNQPERLQRLAERFLDLRELRSDQIMLSSNDFNKILKEPSNEQGKIIKTSLPSKKNVKWRYKDRPDLKLKK